MNVASHSNPKIFITGIDGFTGYHLKQLLELSGFEVFGTAFSFVNTENIFTCDITQKLQLLAALESCKPDYVIHLAGLSFVGHPVTEDFYRINVIGTQNLLDALLESSLKLKKVILASSATVYGNQGVDILDESLCPQPANHYGISKLSMEHMARTYFEKLPLIITRPFNYIGAGQTPAFVIPKIVAHFQQKANTLELGNLQIEREFNDVLYTCEIYKRLLNCDQSGEIVNLCSGRGISLLRVIELMEEISGHHLDVKVNPAFVRKNELHKLIGSVKKLHGFIGDVPQENLKNTLFKMYSVSPVQ